LFYSYMLFSCKKIHSFFCQNTSTYNDVFLLNKIRKTCLVCLKRKKIHTNFLLFISKRYFYCLKCEKEKWKLKKVSFMHLKHLKKLGSSPLACYPNKWERGLYFKKKETINDFLKNEIWIENDQSFFQAVRDVFTTIDCLLSGRNWVPPAFIMCLESLSNLLVMISSSSNFIIYCFISTQFKLFFKKLLEPNPNAF